MPLRRIALFILSAASLALATGTRADTLLVAVSPAMTIDAPCAGPRAGSGDSLAAALTADLSAHIARALVAGGTDAVADAELGSMLLRLDRVSPDPADYRRTREHVTATGAARLIYVNDLRLAGGNGSGAFPCRLSFNAALWNADPFSRRAAMRDSVTAAAESGVPEAARRVAEWILRER